MKKFNLLVSAASSALIQNLRVFLVDPIPPEEADIRIKRTDEEIFLIVTSKKDFPIGKIKEKFDDVVKEFRTSSAGLSVRNIEKDSFEIVVNPEFVEAIDVLLKTKMNGTYVEYDLRDFDKANHELKQFLKKIEFNSKNYVSLSKEKGVAITTINCITTEDRDRLIAEFKKYSIDYCILWKESRKSVDVILSDFSIPPALVSEETSSGETQRSDQTVNAKKTEVDKDPEKGIPEDLVSRLEAAVESLEFATKTLDKLANDLWCTLDPDNPEGPREIILLRKTGAVSVSREQFITYFKKAFMKK